MTDEHREFLGFALIGIGLLVWALQLLHMRVRHWAVQFEVRLLANGTVDTAWMRVSTPQAPYGYDVRTVIGPFRSEALCDEFLASMQQAEEN